MTIDIGTFAVLILVIAALGTASSTLGNELAPNWPRAAAAFRVLAAVLIDVRSALLAVRPASAPTATSPYRTPASADDDAPATPNVPPLVALLIAGVTFLAATHVGLVACSAAARSTAATAISAVASATPLVCSLVSEESPSAGTACSTDAGAASDVARLVAAILAGLPASTAAQAPGFAGVDVVYGGVPVHIVVPAAQASAIAHQLAGGS